MVSGILWLGTQKRALQQLAEALDGQAEFVREECSGEELTRMRTLREARHLANAAHAIEVALRELDRASKVDRPTTVR